MKKNFTIKNFEAIIIGAGGAGLMTAISACDNGLKNIAVITKVSAIHSHTVSAKGGINASLGNETTDDWRWHAFDTIKGGDYLADVDAVEELCRNANQAIIDLERFGVVFSRNERGLIAQRAYGGQTKNFGQNFDNNALAYRACYAKDKTGHTITHTLEQQALKRQVKFYNEFLVIELLISNNKCYGCLTLDINNGELVVFTSNNLVLATGGFSQIFGNTTSSTICTGDGTALALKEGLAVKDMEFVQFHPTGMYGSGFLITEAVRGEGAYLLNAKQERFMKRYAPQMMELASRDVISQAIANEIALGNIDKKIGDCVFLDMRHLNSQVFEKKLPNVVEMVKSFTNKDPARDLIAVAPSAHYSMGGVRCQADGQVCSGLYAVGEVACLSVHGANRLGCNSLLDLIVFGKIVGQKIAQNYFENTASCDGDSKKIIADLITKKIFNFSKIFAVDSQENFSLNKIRNELVKINDKCLGVIRNRQQLEMGSQAVNEFYRQFKKIKITEQSLIWNESLISYLELENLLLNSLATYFSAINREESRGAHHRSDFNSRDDKKFHAHSIVKIVDSEEIKLEFSLEPVKMHSTIAQLNLIPQSRKY